MIKIKTFFKIIIPAILCVIVIHFTKLTIFYYPLSFGLIIGVFNWELHKVRPLVGVFLSLTLSYLTFFIAYFSIFFINYVFSFLGDLGSIITIIFSAFIFAPLIVFFAYKNIFNFPKTKLTILIIIITIIILVIQSYFSFIEDNLSSMKNSSLYKILNPFTIWQIIMALALQIIITQNTLNKSNY